MTRSYHGDVTRFQAKSIASELGGTLSKIVEPLEDRIQQQDVRIRQLQNAVIALWLIQAYWFLLDKVGKYANVWRLAQLTSTTERRKIYRGNRIRGRQRRAQARVRSGNLQSGLRRCCRTRLPSVVTMNAFLRPAR